ncbi:PepSY domain-containing protein [soil metagenome]
MKLKKNITILIVLLAAFALGGAVIAKNKTNSIAENLSPQTRITKEQARKIALERVSGTVVDEEFEKENGKMVYGFEIKDASGKVMEVKIDAETCNIISVEQDDEDSDANGDDDEDNDEMKSDNTNLASQAKITKEEAQNTALKKAKGTVEDSELEEENGKLVYSFDIRNKKGTITEVQVDAKTGEIVSVEEEDAAKEAAEKKQEKMEKDKKKP